MNRKKNSHNLKLTLKFSFYATIFSEQALIMLIDDGSIEHSNLL